MFVADKLSYFMYFGHALADYFWTLVREALNYIKIILCPVLVSTNALTEFLGISVDVWRTIFLTNLMWHKYYENTIVFSVPNSLEYSWSFFRNKMLFKFVVQCNYLCLYVDWFIERDLFCNSCLLSGCCIDCICNCNLTLIRTHLKRNTLELDLRPLTLTSLSNNTHFRCLKNRKGRK